MKEKVVKEPWLAVFLTSILPGLGQMYSQKKLRGIIFLLIVFGFGATSLIPLFFLIFNEKVVLNIKYVIFIGICGLLGALVFIYNLFDSYRCAKEFNRRNDLEIDKARKKSPWLAVFLSDIIPGVGQFYNKEFKKGIVFIILGSIFIGIREYIFILFSLFIILKMFALCEAFQTAERINGRKNYLLRQAKPIMIFLILFSWLLGELPYTDYRRNNIVTTFKFLNYSMEPVLYFGDRVLVNKRIYRKSSPQRGDIIILKYQDKKNKFFISRIVGLPYETLEIKDGKVYIDNIGVENPKINKNYYYNRGKYGKKGLIIKIPSNNYYVLGDNSASSLDSRDFGFVHRNSIEGKVYKIYYPFKRSGKIE